MAVAPAYSPSPISGLASRLQVQSVAEVKWKHSQVSGGLFLAFSPGGQHHQYNYVSRLSLTPETRWLSLSWEETRKLSPTNLSV